MKYILFFVAAASTLWQLNFNYDSWWHTCLLSVLSVSWALGTIYAFDYIKAIAGQSSAYYQDFYGELNKDFSISLLTGFALAIIINLSSANYSFSSIDIAFAGFPFLLLSLYDSFALQKTKVAGARLPKAMTRFLIGLQILVIAIFIYLLILINSGVFAPGQSLWIQITLLLTALCLCILSHQMVFILKRQRMEVSPVLLELFDSIKSSSGLYSQAGEMAEQWNKIVFGKRLELRKKRSNKRKR